MNKLRAFSALFLTVAVLLSVAQSQPYDAIFVGLGTASSITLTKMVTSFPQKSFLVLEMGGPTSKSIGGDDIPSYYESQPAATQKTIFDVPGEYQNIAFQPQGEPYKIPQTFTWQGMGYAGNSQFNGMLFMSPPTHYLDSLPDGWKSVNMTPVFSDLKSRMTVTKSPSSDGQNYLNGISDVLSSGLSQTGYVNVDMSDLAPVENTLGYYNEPSVVTDGNGGRGGPVQAYLTQIIGADGKSKAANLQIIPYATVNSIQFSATAPDTATGVSYTVSGDAAPKTVSLKTGGRVILGAGALMTPRLLYLSGVGPTGKESTVFTSNPVTFARNNAKVGNVFDHVGVQIVLEYDGTAPVQTINYGDISGNSQYLTDYVTKKTGPYCQYGPVLTAHFKSATEQAHPNVELFVNPNGPGDEEFDNGKSFQSVFMLLEPNSNDLLKMDAQSHLSFPSIYLATEQDKQDMVDSIFTFLNQVVPKVAGLKVTKGPADPTSKDSIRAYIDDVGTFIMNHFTGSVPLTAGTEESVGGADPATLRVRGTSNVHVVDASLLPNSVPAHPVAMVMALGSKAGDIFVDLLNKESNPAVSSDVVNDQSEKVTNAITNGASQGASTPQGSIVTPTSQADGGLDNPTLGTVGRQQNAGSVQTFSLIVSLIAVLISIIA